MRREKGRKEESKRMRERKRKKKKSKYSVYDLFLFQIMAVKPEFSHGDVRAGWEARRPGCFTPVALPVQKAHTHTHTSALLGAKRRSPAVPDIVI